MTSRRRLELEQDPAFQRSEWRFQRVGWWALCSFILAAVLGVFGDGPVSHAAAVSPSLQVDYERFARVGTPTELRLRLPTGTAPAGVLYVARRYFDAVRVHRITPEPESITLGSDRVALRFEPPVRPGDAVILEIEPITWGVEEMTLQLESGPPLTVRQIVYF